MTYFVPSLSPTSFAVSFAKTAQLSAAPTLELQFFMTQNAVQARMDKDVAALLEGGSSTAGATAHLTRRLTAVESKLEEIKPYAAKAASNLALVKSTLVLLGELRALADPTTAAAFDVKRTEILDGLDRMRTAGAPPAGMVKDGLGPARTDAIATLAGIVTNGFATPADVTAAQGAIDALTLRLTGTLALVQLNKDISANTVKSLDGIGQRTRAEIDAIEGAARAAQSDKVREAQDYYGRILTIFSLSLDAAVSLTTTFADTLNSDRPPETGTIFDFIA